ncbi:MAG: EAL domain-containing protein [Treponema sp.]|nr:EAL domain-containing protein [Treponema sp.]
MEFGASNYYIIGELITCWVSLLLCVNIVLSFSLYDKRQRLFLYATGATFLAALFDIFSVFAITFYEDIPIPLCTLVSTIYFIFLIVCPYVMSEYALDIAAEHSKYKKVWSTISTSVYIIYLLIILINTKTGWVFRYDFFQGYIRGPLKYMTYSLSAFYGGFIILTVVIYRKSLARRLFWVFVAYPFVSLFFVGIQFFYPHVILTGIASFTSVLFAYVTVQSYLMEMNFVTGLMTEGKLKKRLSMQKKGGVLYIFTIDNINMVQSCLDVAELNLMFHKIGSIFLNYYPRDSYIISINRLAAIGRTIDEVSEKGNLISEEIKKLSLDINSFIPIPIESYSAAIEFSKDDNEYDSMIDLVNNMLNKAKLNQLHKLQICDESIFVDRERKRYIYRILRRELNLDSEQFQVWFQPIYSIEKKKFVYMEALSRLQSTELGDIPPQEFVQVAENRGLIEMLGFVAFEKVCKFISDNRDTVDAVSINFSVYQMMNPNVVANVLDTIKRFSLTPSNIIMEITESIFIDNYELVMKNMLELTKAGVKFYLDDFGTGYSNLTNVISLPFSTIKMDRSLVLAMEESQRGVSLFFDLVSTFKGVGFKILVEGVETNNQNYLVERAGVDYIQGFLYSRPLPAQDCIELFKRLENQKKRS